MTSAAAAYYTLLKAQSTGSQKKKRQQPRDMRAKDAALAMWVNPKHDDVEPRKKANRQKKIERHMNRITWLKVRKIKVREDDGVTAETRVVAVGVHNKSGRRAIFKNDIHWIKVDGGWLITRRRKVKKRKKA